MGLLSFLQRKEATPETPARGRKRAAAAPSADAVQQARTRARQRLIGAAVLLAIGVIGFPLLFETQPRPIPVDLPIEVPRREGAPALALPVARAPAPAASVTAPVTPPVVAQAPAPVITETADDAGREVAPPAGNEAGERAAAAAAPVASRPAAAASRPAPAASRPAAPTDAARAKALLEGKPAAADSGRFVVQVGAFGESNAARDARAKVEKLGLKTYTQVVETEGGKRIRVRVGPFASRAEAQQAASRLRAAGLAGNVLTL